MGWETRNGSGRYFTRSRRVNGRVVREYYGIGLAAELASADQAEQREEAMHQAELVRAQKQADHMMDQALSRLEESIELLMKGTLLSSGFHQHHRGEWRKRK